MIYALSEAQQPRRKLAVRENLQGREPTLALLAAKLKAIGFHAPTKGPAYVGIRPLRNEWLFGNSLATLAGVWYTYGCNILS